MSNQLLPCPFCGHDEPTHDEGDQSAWVQCTNFECGMCGPIASGPSLAAAAWNRRAIQPAAGEPLAHKLVAVQVNGEWKEVRGKWVDGAPIAEMLEGVEEGWCHIELAFAAPSAAAAAASHVGAAVQYRLLRLGEVILATDELLMDDCMTWQPMSNGPQLGIGHEWHAGLVPMRRVEVSERAQDAEGRP